MDPLILATRGTCSCYGHNILFTCGARKPSKNRIMLYRYLLYTMCFKNVTIILHHKDLTWTFVCKTAVSHCWRNTDQAQHLHSSSGLNHHRHCFHSSASIGRQVVLSRVSFLKHIKLMDTGPRQRNQRSLRWKSSPLHQRTRPHWIKRRIEANGNEHLPCKIKRRIRIHC